jgi:hypothetical protein
MYNEEYLPQDDAYDMDDMGEEFSVSVSSQDDSEIIMSKLNTQYKKQVDPGYVKQKIKVDGVLQKVESFASKLNSNGLIRHAITGHRTQYRVGSKYESLFFAVMDSTGFVSNEPRKLYYNSPEEFERHFHHTMPVSQEVKETWLNRKLNLMSSM